MMDRRIRQHLSRARLAALGGPECARTLLAPRVADHIGAFGKLYADKGLAYEVRIAPDIALACGAQDLDELLGMRLGHRLDESRPATASACRSPASLPNYTAEPARPGARYSAGVELRCS